MRTIFGKVKKTLAILLVVFFLVSVTAAAASAGAYHKYSPKHYTGMDKPTTVSTSHGGNAVSTGNGGNGGSANGGNVNIGNGNANGNTINANGGEASGGDGGSIGFVGNGDVDWEGAVASNNRNINSNNHSRINNA